MQVCAKRNLLATEGRRFPSSSSDKVYKVTAYRANEFPFCSCPAYIFTRSKKAKAEGVHQNDIPGTCKHLEQALREACDWAQERDDQYRFDGICPQCGGPVVEIGDVELPEDPSHAVDDLRALLANLNGEEAPAPLPRPRPFVVEFTTTLVATHRMTLDALTVEEAAAAFVNLTDDEINLLPQETVGAPNVTHALVQAMAPEDVPKPKRGPRKKADPAAPARRRASGTDVDALVKGATGR